MDDNTVLQNEFAKLDAIKNEIINKELREAGAGFHYIPDKNIFDNLESNKPHSDYITDLEKRFESAVCEEFKNLQRINDRRRRKWFYSEISKYAKMLLDDFVNEPK
jgi:hypothetical protein